MRTPGRCKDQLQAGWKDISAGDLEQDSKSEIHISNSNTSQVYTEIKWNSESIYLFTMITAMLHVLADPVRECTDRQ